MRYELDFFLYICLRKKPICQAIMSINFKQLAMADLDINSNVEPLSKEIEQALSNFLKNRKKRKKALVVETTTV